MPDLALRRSNEGRRTSNYEYIFIVLFCVAGIDSFTAKETKETKVTKVTKPLTPTQNDMITFRSKRYANGTDQCSSDIPSVVYNYSQLEESSVGPVGVPGSVLCAWKCKTDEGCVSFNWKYMYDRQLCELFFYVVASCHFVAGCAFHEVRPSWINSLYLIQLLSSSCMHRDNFLFCYLAANLTFSEQTLHRMKRQRKILSEYNYSMKKINRGNRC